MRISFFIVLALMLNASPLHAHETCLKTKGESLLIHGDRGSAKLEALAQAKWYAIEQAVGVHIKSQSLVQNYSLVDDTVIKKVDGVITGYKILNEGVDNGLYHTTIRACVEKAKAGKVVDKLARNTAVATLIMSSSKRVVAERESAHVHHISYADQHSDESPLATSLNNLLIRQGVEVVSLDSVFKGNREALTRSLTRGNFSEVSRMMAQSLSKVVIIGHIRNKIASEKGRNIGYGISMPVYRVTSYFSYKILNRAGNGSIELLKAGESKGVGMGTALETANQAAMEELSSKVSEDVVSGVIKHIQGLSRQVEITVAGVPDSDSDQVIRDQLQASPWVMQMENISLGHYRIRYPESSLYLANTLSRMQGVRVRDYSSLSIHAEYRP